MNERVTAISERMELFTEKAAHDIYCLEHTFDAIQAAIESGQPIKYSIADGPAQGSKEVTVEVDNLGHGVLIEDVVLTVMNYHLFPVTAILDSIKLSQNGKLDDALDTRPLMFSGPAPTMIIWSGSDWSNKLDYPELSREDVVKAFNHWLNYIFGVTLSSQDTVNG